METLEDVKKELQAEADEMNNDWDLWRKCPFIISGSSMPDCDIKCAKFIKAHVLGKDGKIDVVPPRCERIS